MVEIQDNCYNLTLIPEPKTVHIQTISRADRFSYGLLPNLPAAVPILKYLQEVLKLERPRSFSNEL